MEPPAVGGCDIEYELSFTFRNISYVCVSRTYVGSDSGKKVKIPYAAPMNME